MLEGTREESLLTVDVYNQPLQPRRLEGFFTPVLLRRERSSLATKFWPTDWGIGPCPSVSSSEQDAFPRSVRPTSIRPSTQCTLTQP